MPAVITYWQLPEDEQLFLDYLDNSGQLLAYHNYGVQDESDLKPIPLREYLKTYNPTQFVFGPEEHLSGFHVEELYEDGIKYLMGPDGMRDCVLTYDATRIRDGNKLCLSNLAAYWTRLDETGKAIVDKDPEFVAWGKKVFSWVRRNTPEWHKYKSYRATRAAKDAFERGTLIPMEY